MKKPKPTTAQLVKSLLARVNKLEKKVKELENELLKRDLEEITQIDERMNRPSM